MTLTTSPCTISIDARVWLALHEVPDSEPIERIAEHADISFDDMRASMRRLALRQTPGPMALGVS